MEPAALDLDGTGFSSSALGFTGSLVSAEDGTTPGAPLAGTSIGAWVDSGGSISEGGLSGTSLLVGSGAVDVGMDLSGGTEAASFSTGRSLHNGTTAP